MKTSANIACVFFSHEFLALSLSSFLPSRTESISQSSHHYVMFDVLYIRFRDMGPPYEEYFRRVVPYRLRILTFFSYLGILILITKPTLCYFFIVEMQGAIRKQSWRKKIFLNVCQSIWCVEKKKKKTEYSLSHLVISSEFVQFFKCLEKLALVIVFLFIGDGDGCNLYEETRSLFILLEQWIILFYSFTLRTSREWLDDFVSVYL